MKKLLLVTGVLALSLSAFATSAHDAKEATVEVKAKVVQPLCFASYFSNKLQYYFPTFITL